MTVPAWKKDFEKTAAKDDMELHFDTKPKATWSSTISLTPQQKKAWASLERSGLVIVIDKSGKVLMK